MSMIDYPQQDLPTDIWMNTRNGEKMIRPDVKGRIEGLVGKILTENFINPRGWYEGLLMGSSIASQFYTPETDVDVKIVIDFPRFQRNNPDFGNMSKEELTVALINIIKKYKDVYTVGADRPLDFFFIPMDRINQDEVLAHFDSLYNITLNTWIVRPRMVDIKDYDRDKVVSEGEDMATEWAEKWDLDIGRIQRKFSDFDHIREYLRSMPPEEKKRYRKQAETIQSDLEKEIDELTEDRQEIKELRRKAYDEFADDIDSYYGYINALPDVIQMKMLTLWGYMKIVKEIGDFGEEISSRTL